MHLGRVLKPHPPVHYSVSKVDPPLSSCHTFLLELQAVSPRHCVVVQLKWYFIDFVDAMQIFVDFDHVFSCASIVQAW